MPGPYEDQIKAPGSVIAGYDDRSTAERALGPFKNDPEFPNARVATDAEGRFYLAFGLTQDAPSIVTGEGGQEWWKIPDAQGGFRFQIKRPDQAIPDPPSAQDIEVLDTRDVGRTRVYQLRGGTIIQETIQPDQIDPGDVNVDKRLPAGEGREYWILNNGDSFFVDVSKPETQGPIQFSHMITEGGLNLAVLSDGSKIPVERETIHPDAQVETTELGGRTFIQVTQPNGSVSLKELAPKPRAPTDATVRGIGGREFIQTTEGELQNLPPLSIEQIRDRMILNNDWEAAVAIDDFINRPTSGEALQAALDFSRSPADTAVISALARGEAGIVEPHFQAGADTQALGGVRRIGPQPEFLQSAYQRFLDSLEAGRPPTLEEATESLQPPLSLADIKSAAEDAAIRAIQANPGISADDIREILKEEGVLTGEDISKLDEVIKGKTTTRTDSGKTGGTSDVLTPSAETAITGAERFAQARAAFEAAGFTDFDSIVSSFGASGLTLEQIISGVNSTLADRQSSQESDETQQTGIQGAQDAGAFSETFGVDPGASFGSGDTTLSDLGDLADRLAKDEDEFDFFAKGGVTRGRNLEIVGEGGQPELVDLPPGTRVTPIKDLSDEEVAALKERGVPGMQGGGLVTNPAAFPLGVKRLLGGAAIRPARSVFPAAGLTVPSSQAQSRLLPSELAFFRSLSEEAGIPGDLFDRELRAPRPGRSGRRARFLAEVAN